VVALVPWGEDLVAAGTVGTGQVVGGTHLTLVRSGPGDVLPLATSVPAVSVLAASSNAPADGAFLFVGGGALPGDFPNAAPSELLQYEGTGFHGRMVTNLGFVTGAIFAALEASEGPELITVSEWGAPRVFRVQGARLSGWDPPVAWEKSAPVKLSALSGWWQSVAAADFDQDGRIDLVLGNWGLNSSYALYTGPPRGADQRGQELYLYHGNFDPGPRTGLEGYAGLDGRILPIHGLSEWARHLSWASGQFPSYRAFAVASVEQILGDRTRSATRLDCRGLTSLILLNRGDHFAARSLPDLAQLGPLWSLQVADFDGDGHWDLYGAQGFAGHNFGRSRDDGGEGVFLMGRGDGEFEAVAAAEAGFRLLGEQRSAVVRDVNRDRRPDLIIGEYGGPVTVLINRGR